jgi:hypothetical protein
MPNDRWADLQLSLVFGRGRSAWPRFSSAPIDLHCSLSREAIFINLQEPPASPSSRNGTSAVNGCQSGNGGRANCIVVFGGWKMAMAIKRQGLRTILLHLVQKRQELTTRVLHLSSGGLHGRIRSRTVRVPPLYCRIGDLCVCANLVDAADRCHGGLP